MADKKRQNLGRGLSALLGKEWEEMGETDRTMGSREVPIEFLRPGRYQPRHSMSEERIEELAQSIRENGIIQPLLVRRDQEQKDFYEIIAGERRWRAAQLAKVHVVPVVIRDLNDQQSLEIALVENLQRQDLSPLEEADGYKRLMDEFSHTQDALAKTVGKSRSHVANMMRLLGLPAPVKKLLDAGELTAGHARALLNAPDAVELAREVVKRGLNVRQTERLVRKKQRQREMPPTARKKDVDTAALERDLSNLLGLRVAVKFKGGGGSITVHYDSLEQLDDVLRRLNQSGPSTRARKTSPTAVMTAAKAETTPVASKALLPKLKVGLRAAARKRKPDRKSA
ncbi:MAG: ParB/RepB/Spo0J family partition protein [Rhodospirillales bacterium]|nr:ParB/RepB/Spo0J family partition protein [Rhodospirillales bacterium]